MDLSIFTSSDALLQLGNILSGIVGSWAANQIPDLARSLKASFSAAAGADQLARAADEGWAVMRQLWEKELRGEGKSPLEVLSTINRPDFLTEMKEAFSGDGCATIIHDRFVSEKKNFPGLAGLSDAALRRLIKDLYRQYIDYILADESRYQREVLTLLQRNKNEIVSLRELSAKDHEEIQNRLVGLQDGHNQFNEQLDKIIKLLKQIHPVPVQSSPQAILFDPAVLRRSYLNSVFEQTRFMALGGIDKRAVQPGVENRLPLDKVYTALMTLTPEWLEEKPGVLRQDRLLSALDMLSRHRRLVLLGDPGSGKSTFVTFVTLCMAGELSGRPEANLALLTAPLPPDEEKPGEPRKEEKPVWSREPLLPVRIILRDFAARGLPPPGEPATALHLWKFMADGLAGSALAEYAGGLKAELMAKGGLILLDGLDEVPEAERRREQIKQAVEDFARIFFRCRFLVTSRTYAYQKQDWRLGDFQDAVLAPFSPVQIDWFVGHWYAQVGELRGMAAEEAQGRAELLRRAIKNSGRLAALAGRPLLLALMASLHAWRGGSLPEKREELYADTVDLLLDWWESPKIVRDGNGRVMLQEPSLAEWLKVDRNVVRDRLNELACQAHTRQPEIQGTADLPEKDLVAALLSVSNNPDLKPRQLIEYLSGRAGLLLPRGIGVYTFPHRTLQEYLAACHLTDHDFPDQVADLARRDPDRWREVALLSGAKAARGTAAASWLLVEELCFREAGAVSTPEDRWGALLAGQLLVENADPGKVAERNRPKLERVAGWLAHLIRLADFPAVERAEAGNILGRLGDPRFDPGRWHLPKGENLGFEEIPAGPFTMGTKEEDVPFLRERFGAEEKWYRRETPRHQVDLPMFYLARYPVTVAQFRAFVEANGYEEHDPDSLRGEPHHPVVRVSFHDALAYCRWLTETLRNTADFIGPLAERLRQKEMDGRSWQVTLPSEAEWEKAARGGGDDVRIFPWGDAWDANRANTGETGIGGTSAAGCFPGGASPFGIEELAGNVWEWTRSLWGKNWQKPDFDYPYIPGDTRREDLNAPSSVRRVVRGGGFYLDPRSARCSFRFGDDPDFRLNYLGFRVAVSPVFSDL